MANAFSPLARLLLGNLADVPVAVRQRMLATIPTTLLSLTFYSFTLLVICATTVFISRTAWAWGWLLFSVAMLAWRFLCPVIARRRGQPEPLVGIMVSAGLSMVSFGFGSTMAILSGDIALMTISLSGSMGILAGLATRWAALPRPAIASMVLTMAPPAFTLMLAGGAYMAAALVILCVVISVATFTKHNQENLLAAITAEELHRRMAQTDHLTGLANRAQLIEQIALYCNELPARGSDNGRRFAVLYIDLDGFKAVNDTHGHAAGDEILQRVADCLRQVTGPDEMVARIGGDEFVVLLRDADGLTARGVADEIISVISRDHRITDGRALRVGCSVGISLAPLQGREPETLLARADAALYEVKNQGKGHTGLWRALGDG
jgi:diguanylate cyclase (GGDEF)-like protein